MGYSNFKKIKTVVKKFNLDSSFVQLFQAVELVEPSQWLKETLAIAKLMPLLNEKTKAERVISPILLEVVKQYVDKISFFSGESIDVDAQQDLSGECDFFFCLQPPKLYLEAPVISIAECKDEDIEWGTAQCAAQLYGAKLFNEMEGKNIPVLYGCATDGVEWQFMRFENNMFQIDNKIYTDLKEILGVWHHIINLYIEPKN
jgi:hypothetical protein